MGRNKTLNRLRKTMPGYQFTVTTSAAGGGRRVSYCGATARQVCTTLQASILHATIDCYTPDLDARRRRKIVARVQRARARQAYDEVMLELGESFGYDTLIASRSV